MLAAAAASLARFAASLSPLVPFRPAELLITPLLPELMVSLLVSSTFLQPDAPIASAAIDTASNVPFGFQCMVAPVQFVARGATGVHGYENAAHRPCPASVTSVLGHAIPCTPTSLATRVES